MCTQNIILDFFLIKNVRKYIYLDILVSQIIWDKSFGLFN